MLMERTCPNEFVQAGMTLIFYDGYDCTVSSSALPPCSLAGECIEKGIFKNVLDTAQRGSAYSN